MSMSKKFWWIYHIWAFHEIQSEKRANRGTESPERPHLFIQTSKWLQEEKEKEKKNGI